MEIIITFIKNLLLSLGLEDSTFNILYYVSMVVTAALLATLSYYICRKIIVPLIIKLILRTNIKWASELFNNTILYTTCWIAPLAVIWNLLSKVFFQCSLVKNVLTFFTSVSILFIYTILFLQIVDRLQFLDKRQGSSLNQYLKSFIGILKVIIVFISTIIMIGIFLGKDPMTLLTGLGAMSAVLMLVFKDTIEGLVASIRLTSNEMVHVGDWITVPGTPVDGNVVDITLTTVKVRQFDNTYTTVSPLTLVNGSFKNWKGMQDSGMRQVSKKIYFDVRSIRLLNDETRQNLTSKNMVSPKEMEGEVVNIGLFRHYIDTYLRKRDDVNKSATLMVRQLEATQNGLPIELYFFLETTDWVNYEQKTSDILEHIYAYANEFGLQIYEGFAAINK
ncbi:mechanosensitive ion channel protein [Prevotella intermedia]|uniref:Mechanosensitive ion channel protein n=1 Tax=Prevotella intermedia TaxID=28131 RepID=A0AAJ3RTI8_PREIN|nr:mechanosensitive ion channel domain-containing protein [Prevotella intermedia]ATV54307.1 mechanosensitive ion channel protein [Prevotella intermedia]PJI20691.1 mechanosensitive ion channel protein [Prevotella intermedia]